MTHGDLGLAAGSAGRSSACSFLPRLIFKADVLREQRVVRLLLRGRGGWGALGSEAGTGLSADAVSE